MFLLDAGEGDVVRCESGYGRVSGVTVHLPDGRLPMVSASARRCRADGTEDARFKGGNAHCYVKLPNEVDWIEQAIFAVLHPTNTVAL